MTELTFVFHEVRDIDNAHANEIVADTVDTTEGFAGEVVERRAMMMNVESVQSAFHSHIVHAGHGAEYGHNPYSGHGGNPSDRSEDGAQDKDAPPHPVLNDLGQLTGRQIDVTV
jgi:hypothetical protein